MAHDTTHLSFITQLRIGLVLALFSFFAGAALTWVQVRNVSRLDKRSVQVADQLPIVANGTVAITAAVSEGDENACHDLTLTVNPDNGTTFNGADFYIIYSNNNLAFSEFENLLSTSEWDIIAVDNNGVDGPTGAVIRFTLVPKVDPLGHGITTTTDVVKLKFCRKPTFVDGYADILLVDDVTYVATELSDTESLKSISFGFMIYPNGSVRDDDITEIPTTPPETVCSQGESQCVGGTHQTCGTSGQWQNSPCPDGQSCTGAGVCTAMTTPECSVSICANATQLKTCNTDGTWGSTTNCPSGICAENACRTCSNNTNRCTTGGVKQTCTNWQWQDNVCPTGQTCTGNGVCTATTTNPTSYTLQLKLRKYGRVSNGSVVEGTDILKKDGLAIPVQLKVYERGGNNAQLYNGTVTFTSDAQGVFSSTPINLNTSLNQTVDIEVHGPRHAPVEFSTVTVTSGVIDLTSYSLRPGDVAITCSGDSVTYQQDGHIDSCDYNAILDRMYSSNANDITLADLDYNNVVDEDDVALFIQTLYNQSNTSIRQ